MMALQFVGTKAVCAASQRKLRNNTHLSKLKKSTHSKVESLRTKKLKHQSLQILLQLSNLNRQRNNLCYALAP